jgi:hypothetical protein
MRRRPTRRDLLVVIGQLQRLIGEASMHHGNDRDANGFEKGVRVLREAHALCVDARAYDPPIRESGPWSAATGAASAASAVARPAASDARTPSAGDE